jgi:putative tricarboxylic transport membrane protein
MPAFWHGLDAVATFIGHSLANTAVAQSAQDIRVRPKTPGTEILAVGVHAFMQPDVLAMAWHALTLLLEPARLGILVLGVLIGLAIGVLPGLNGIVGMAMLIPFTYNMDQHTAMALLLGMAAVITSSDFITAVLFGVPGHVGAAATVIDGHAMAKNGEAGRAFGAGFASSLAGGLVGAVVLALSIPILRPVLLAIGSPELLAFTLFGLSRASPPPGSG